MTHFQVELAAAAKRARAEGRPFPDLLPTPPRDQSSLAGVSRTKSLDEMIDLFADVFEEIDAVYRVLVLRAVEEHTVMPEFAINAKLNELNAERLAMKESLRNLETYIAQP